MLLVSEKTINKSYSGHEKQECIQICVSCLNIKMAKKNVISDFGALKGKVSFSEGLEVHPSQEIIQRSLKKSSGTRSEKTDTDSSLENGNCLKVGQSVVLMDSDLSGRIASLGKTVRIEFEDGLVIEAAYGEFAVTDKAEIASLKEAKIKRKNTGSKTRMQKQTAPDGSLTVDLHIEAIPGGRNTPKGRQLQFQMDTFRRVIRENINRKGMKITFIHGIGDGILKAAIRKELDEVLALRCSYSVGDPAVTVVTIR